MVPSAKRAISYSPSLLRMTPPVPAAPLPAPVGKIQASRVKVEVGCRLGLAVVPTKEVPLDEKAWPTFPVLKPAPFCRPPLLPSALSLALPSPRHQLTRLP